MRGSFLLGFPINRGKRRYGYRYPFCCHVTYDMSCGAPTRTQQPPKATRYCLFCLFFLMRVVAHPFHEITCRMGPIYQVCARQPVMGVVFCISRGEMAPWDTLSTRVDGCFRSFRCLSERETIETGTEAMQYDTKPKRPLGDILVTGQVSRQTRSEL